MLCHFLLFILHTNLIFKLHKAYFYPHFNVQIMATKRYFLHIFQDILAAILKGALYLEFSRIVKNMLYAIASYCLLHTNLVFLTIIKAFSHHFSVQTMAKMVIF